MDHFRHQGMTGLLGFTKSLLAKRMTCKGSGSSRGKPTRGSTPASLYGKNNVPLFQCIRCNERYSARQATALWGIRLCEEDYLRVAKSLAEGNGIRTTSRIFDLDKDTVQRCAYSAGQHCRLVESVLMHHLHLEECQLDEMWSFVYKKQGHLSPFEQLMEEIGDIWLHVAFEPRLKLFLAIVPAKRTLENIRMVTRTVRSRSDGYMPLFTGDEYAGNLDALLWEYGQLARENRQGLVGRPPQSSYLIPTSGINFAVVNKVRENGKVSSVKSEIVLGSKRKIQRILDESPCSRNINISFVERSNLHQRLNNRRLTRKTLGYSKKLPMHKAQLWLCRGYYHYVRPHSSLKVRSDDGTRWIQRTPAMAAGVTNHIWTMKELLTFPNCYN
jgi:IS1 family transposase